MWHEFDPAVLSKRVKWEYGTTKWREQFLVVCVEKMHQLQIEMCVIVHECEMSRIRIEDHHSLLIYIRLLYRCIDAYSFQVLKQCEDKLSSLTTDALKDVIYEIMYLCDIDRVDEAFNNTIRRIR